MIPVMNMKESLWMFMTVVIKCHSVNYDIFNAKLTWFGMSLLSTWHWSRQHNLLVSLLWQLHINQDNMYLYWTCHNRANNQIISYKLYVLTLHLTVTCGWFWHWLSRHHDNCVMNIFLDLGLQLIQFGSVIKMSLNVITLSKAFEIP